MNKKIGRNDKCPCGSKKKYKICCIVKDENIKKQQQDQLDEGHIISSENIKDCQECLLELYPTHKIIDISNILTSQNYTIYQKRHYYNKIIMLAERNENNNEVFKSRGPDNVNIMVLHQGSYRCFDFNDLDLALDEIVAMIDKKNNISPK